MDWEGQRSRAHSTPTSELSQSTNSSQERIPPYKQLNPSPVMSALSKLSDDDLFRKGGEEILRMLRRVESDYKNLLTEHSSVIKDVNRRFQIFVLETRGLKEINQKLQDDNQELRDLCCFLDDDRQRSRKLAREWQRFGRYTASVMHSEVAAYQEKLKQLEERQTELLSDNLELKELCLFLDHERSQVSGDRDDGDGSSSGTVPGQEDVRQSQRADSDGQLTPTPTPTPDSSSPYVRQLELKIQRLEEERKQLAQRVERNSADGYHPADQGSRNTRQDASPNPAGEGRQGAVTPGRERGTPTASVSKPEAVVHAMKVLQVHEQLERQHLARDTNEDLETPQKAIVREMCNVVWRKLGDVGEYPSHTPAPTPFSKPPPQPQPHPAPSIPYRPQSAIGNPVHSSSSGHAGPPLSKSLPGPLSFPASPPDGPSPYLDVHGNVLRMPPSSGGHREGQGLGVGGHHPGAVDSGGQGQWVERRGGGGGGGHGFQAPKQAAGGGGGQVTSPGRREEYPPRGMMMGGGEGRDHMSGPGGGGRGGGGMQENVPRAGQGGGGGVGGHSGPERSRQMHHPPPYSTAKSCPTLLGPSSGHSSSSQHHPPPTSPHSQMQQQQQHYHNPAPSSRQQQQQQQHRYQQRVHPLHANQPPPPPPSSSSHNLPRSVSGPATYYVSHPTGQQPRTQQQPPPPTTTTTATATAMPSYHHQPQSAAFMYSRGGGSGGGSQSPFRHLEHGRGGSRPGGESGRPERRQTYLDD
ncbi:hypothetical protein ACOMHN_064377 [Nucella lapillus]